MEHWSQIFNPETKGCKKSAKTIVCSFMNAITQKDWEKIENEISPEIASFSNEKDLIIELFRYVDDDDPNKRNAVTCCLNNFDFVDAGWRLYAISKMKEMATSDNDVVTAGRAAMFLERYIEDEKYSRVIKIALENFASRARENKWIDELIENIPGIKRIL